MAEKSSSRSNILAEKVNSLVKDGQWLKSEDKYEDAMLKIDTLKKSMQNEYSKRGL